MLMIRGVRCVLWSLATLDALDLARRHDTSVKRKKRSVKGNTSQGLGHEASTSFLDDIERDEKQDAFAGAR